MRPFRILSSIFLLVLSSACGGSAGDLLCGNSVIDAGETCDLGANNGPGSTCSLVCLTQSNTTNNLCGNGIVDVGEICDPNDLGTAIDLLSGATCDAQTCTYGTATGGLGGVGGVDPLLCGNGALDAGEVCDPLDPITQNDLITGLACDPNTCTYNGLGGGIVVAGGVVEVLCSEERQTIALNSQINSTNQYSTYSCTNEQLLGLENTVAITVPFAAEVELDIDDGGRDLDGAVMIGAPDPNQCIEFFRNRTEIDVQAGTVLYVILDSESINDGGEYELKVECER